MSQNKPYIPQPQVHFDSQSETDDAVREPRQLDDKVLDELLHLVREGEEIRNSAPQDENSRKY